MSALNQNAPRMRRHKRRINDDGSELAHAVRAFVDQHVDDSAPLVARQADGANGVGPGGSTRGGNTGGAPAMGGLGNTGTDPTTGDDGSDTTHGSNGNGNGNGNGNSNGNGNGSTDTRTAATATATTTTPTRNLFNPTTTSSSSTQGNLLDSLTQYLLPSTTSSSSTRSTSTSTSSSTTPSSTSTSTSTTSSTSTRSSSTSSSTSSVSVPTSSSSPNTESQTTAASDQNNPDNSSTNTHNDDNSTLSSATSIVPITATAIVTATPTASVAAADASTTPKSSSSSAGPIIGIVAGALVGVVVLSGLIGFLFKKYRKQDDPYEANPFDRDAFQRHSAMIPDHYESDEGHGGAGGMSPEMSEHYQQYNNFGPQYESGISAGAAGAMGAMAAHNETGGPRPPTMFAKHAAGVQQNQPQVGGYYKDGDYSNQMAPMPHSDYHAPPVAAFASNHHADQQYLDEPGFGQNQRSISPAPQLPPLAAFGGDPYSIAGVGRGQQQPPHNVANPYAHLDRSHGGSGFTPGSVIPHHRAGGSGSGSVSSAGADSADQRHASINAAEALAAGLAHQASLKNRSGSPSHHDASAGAGYDTAGRPGTAEARSGTPDIPNVQQTYALPNDVAGHHASQDAAPLRNPYDHRQPAHQPQQPQQPQPQQQYHEQQQQQLSVRNLVPNAAGLSAGQRPISTASSFADPEDAYGGVY